MKRCILIILFCLFLAGIACASDSPNFIIFYTDDQGWADTSVPMMDGEPLSRSDFYQTPALERLAARGMRFTSGYSPTPTCTGSRISIQFGQTSARLQYRNVFDVLSKKQRPNGWDDEISMAAVVKAAKKNYITAHFGKGMGVRRMDHAGYDVTDEYDKGPNGNGHGHYIDVKKKIPIPDDNPKRIKELTKRSVDFVEEHAGKRPFYLMISHYAVHVPFQASPRAIERCGQRWISMGRPDVDMTSGERYKNTKEYREWLYAAMIEETDANLGALLDALERAGELNNTYIIFTSDNGGGHGRRDEHKNRFNGPLQEGKRSTFEGGLRVPFVVAGPGIKPGSQCDVPVVQWDLLPTLHDLSGSRAPLPAGVDGGSLHDVFNRGNQGTVARGAPGLVFHYPCHYHPPISVIRVGDYKLMRHLNSGEMKLFNVAKDYREQHDLAVAMPEKTVELNRIRQRYIDKVDGGSVEDVYAAYAEFLDNVEQKAQSSFQKKMGTLEQTNPPDRDVQKTKLKHEWEKKKRELFAKRGINKAQGASHSWREGAKQEAVESMGIDKKGNVLVPKPK
jgi:arylsulfatase A